MFDPRKCPDPWTKLFIRYDGVYFTCCFQKPVKAGFENLAAFWNSAEIKKMRENVACFDSQDSRCHVCVSNFDTDRKDFFSDLKQGCCTPEQKQNVEDAKNCWLDKKINVDAFPLFISLCFGTRCNLDCIMCFQRDARHNCREVLDPQILYPQADFLSHAAEISLIGGEIFLIPEALEFLHFAAEHEKLKNVKYEVVSNGTVIDKHIALLENFGNLSLCFSVDSHGKYYEKIRRGASWEKVKSNIEKINELSKKHSGWTAPFIHCVLMKSGIPGLYDLCKWVVENKLQLAFDRIASHSHCMVESIFDNPGLVNDIPGWREIFENSIKLQYKNNYDLAAAQLVEYFALLSRNQYSLRGEFHKILDMAGDDLTQCLFLCEPDSLEPAGFLNITTDKSYVGLPMVAVTPANSGGNTGVFFEISAVFPNIGKNCTYICRLYNQDYDELSTSVIGGDAVKTGGTFIITQYVSHNFFKSIRLAFTPITPGEYALPARVTIRVTCMPDKTAISFLHKAKNKIKRFLKDRF